MPTYTRMKKADLKYFGDALAQSYSTLHGTPVAAQFLNIAKKIQNVYIYWDTEHRTINDPNWEVEEDMRSPLELENGNQLPFYQYAYTGNYITEERLRETGVDADIDNALTALRAEQANHAAGTAKRTLIDFAISGLEKIRRRELVVDADNPEFLENPGADTSFKFANFSFVPQIGQGNGLDRPLPDDFPQDDPFDNVIKPRENQLTLGIHPEAELDEAVQRANLDNVFQASNDLVESQRAVNNMIANGQPDAQREQILKQNLLSTIDPLIEELQRATNAANDDRTLPVFNDLTHNRNDVLSPDAQADRCFARDIEHLRDYKNYVNSALPLEGYAEYNELLNYLEVEIQNVTNSVVETITNANPYLQQLQGLQTALRNLPQAQDQVDAWQNDIRTRIQSVIDTGTNLRNNPQYDLNKTSLPAYVSMIQDHHDRLELAKANLDPNSPEYQQIETRQHNFTAQITQLNNEYRAWEQDRNAALAKIGDITTKFNNTFRVDFQHPGQRTRERKNRYINRMLDGLQQNVRQMSDELRAFRRRWFLGDAMQTALHNAIRSGMTDIEAGPVHFLTGLRQLQEVARQQVQQGNRRCAPILEWANKNAAYFESRILEAQSKGIPTDVNAQFERNMRDRHNGQDRLQESLTLFNTRRARYFEIVGRTTEAVGAESVPHENLRTATETLINQKNALANIDRNANPAQWRQAMNDMLQSCITVYGRALDYMQRNNFNRPHGTEAGGLRFDGARAIWNEAAKMYADYKTQLAQENQYQALAQKTIQNQQRAQQRANARTQRANAFALQDQLAQQQQQQQQLNQNQNQAQNNANNPEANNNNIVNENNVNNNEVNINNGNNGNVNENINNANNGNVNENINNANNGNVNQNNINNENNINIINENKINEIKVDEIHIDNPDNINQINIIKEEPKHENNINIINVNDMIQKQNGQKIMINLDEEIAKVQKELSQMKAALNPGKVTESENEQKFPDPNYRKDVRDAYIKLTALNYMKIHYHKANVDSKMLPEAITRKSDDYIKSVCKDYTPRDLYKMATEGKAEKLWNAYAAQYNQNKSVNSGKKMTLYVPPVKPENSGPTLNGKH